VLVPVCLAPASFALSLRIDIGFFRWAAGLETPDGDANL
jgi:hypothetical protein